jgi:hypothetical protein
MTAKCKPRQILKQTLTICCLLVEFSAFVQFVLFWQITDCRSFATVGCIRIKERAKKTAHFKGSVRRMAGGEGWKISRETQDKWEKGHRRQIGGLEKKRSRSSRTVRKARISVLFPRIFPCYFMNII